MFTNLTLVRFAQDMLQAKARYWYGTFCQTASTSLYNSKRAQYPAHYTSARAAQYQRDIASGRTVCDCAGLIKGFFWTKAGARAPVYGDGFPDTNADGIIAKECAQTGNIGNLPEVPGLVLWTGGHIGIYVGGGYAIEARGFSFGVVKTRVADRNWKKWGRLKAKYISYVDGGVDPGTGGEPPKEPALGDRLLKYRAGQTMQRGADVAALRSALIKLGFGRYLGADGADGVFGPNTAKAVRAFQKAHRLEIDGDSGPMSHAKLAALLVATEPSEPENPDPLNEDDLPPEPEEPGEPDPPDSDEQPDPDAGMGTGAQNPYALPTRTLREGAKGEGVRWLQWELLQSGHSVGPDGIDGEFGPNTLRAVKQFQAEHRDASGQPLAVDGEAGPLTRAALLAEDGPAPPAERDKSKIIDVSHHDGTINWSKVGAITGPDKIELVIIRVQDNAVLDRQLARNVSECKRYGIPYGVYAFFRAPTEAAARAEADRFFERAMAAGAAPLFWMVDVETQTATWAQQRKAVAAYIAQLQKHGARRVGVYMGHHIYAYFTAIMEAAAIKWVPRWNGAKTPPAHPYDLWQTGYSKVVGIGSNVDTNRLAPGRTLRWLMTGTD